MTTPLPTAGDTTWYDWATDVDNHMKGLLTSETTSTITSAARDVVEVDSEVDIDVTLPTDLNRSIEICQVNNGVVTPVAAPHTAIRVAKPSLGVKTSGLYSSIWVRPRPIAPTNPPFPGKLLYRLKGDSLGANGTAIASWPDSSSYTNPDAIQTTSGNRPTVVDNAGGTGHKGANFNGSHFLNLSGSTLNLARNKSALTVFAALVFPTAVTTGTRTIFSLSTGTGATSSRLLLGHRDSTSGLPIAGGRRNDTDSLGYINGIAINTATNAILCGRYLWGTSDIALEQNGTQVGFSGSFQTIGSTTDTASLAGTIGSNLAGNNEFGIFTLLELLVFDSDDADGRLRQYVDSYFYTTYGFSSADYLTKEFVVNGGS